MDREVWSPVEIAKSVGELLLRAVLSLWAILTGLVAGLAAIAEHVSPGAHISDRLWFRIALGGAVVSLVWAYHRTRMERSAAHARDVRPDHLEELQGRLNQARASVTSDRLAQYGDRSNFAAHYPDVVVVLDTWDHAVQRVGAAEQGFEDALDLALNEPGENAPWRGISAPDYDVNAIRALIREFVMRRAQDGTLGNPARMVPWTEGHPLPPPPGSPPIPPMRTISLGDERNLAWVPEEPADGLRERVEAVHERIESLWREAETWDSGPKIVAARQALAVLKASVLEELDHASRVSGLRVKRGCSICRANEEWSDPARSRQRVSAWIGRFRRSVHRRVERGS